MLIKNGFRIKKIILAVGVTVGVFGFVGSSFADTDPSEYTISMNGWAQKPGCSDGTSIVNGYVSGLRYLDFDNKTPTNMTLTIPKETINSLINAKTPYTGQSIWNGIDFAVDGGPDQTFQPVLWKGSNFSIPQNNQLENYIWVYDNKNSEFTKSQSWNAKNLDTYSELANLETPIILHYFENNSWNEITSDNIDEFDKKVNQLQDKGGLFVNSQYVEFTGKYYKNGYNAQYDQISQDIIAVPSGANASVTMQIDVPNDGSSITMTSTVNIPNVKESPKSVLKVTQLHAPQSKFWSTDNVYKMTNDNSINLWQDRANAVFPVVIEAGVGNYPNSLDPNTCAKTTIDAWNNQKINITMTNGPDNLLKPNTVKQVDDTNQIYSSSDWINTKEYDKGAIVNYKGKSYQCMDTWGCGKGVEPGTNAEWSEVK